MWRVAPCGVVPPWLSGVRAAPHQVNGRFPERRDRKPSQTLTPVTRFAHGTQLRGRAGQPCSSRADGSVFSAWHTCARSCRGQGTSHICCPRLASKPSRLNRDQVPCRRSLSLSVPPLQRSANPSPAGGTQGTVGGGGTCCRQGQREGRTCRGLVSVTSGRPQEGLWQLLTTALAQALASRPEPSPRRAVHRSRPWAVSQ